MKMLAELILRAMKLINLLFIANTIVQDEHHPIAAFDHLDQLCLFQVYYCHAQIGRLDVGE